MESSDGETLIEVGIWFQICGAAEEKAWHPKSSFYPGNMQERLASLEERRKRLGWWWDTRL